MFLRLPRFSRLVWLLAGSLYLNFASADVSLSGSWFDPTHNGEGFIVHFFDENRAVVYWFTYTEEGNQRWFIGLGDFSDGVLQIDELLMPEGGKFGPEFDPGDITNMPVGTLTLTFESDGAGLAEYTINDVDGQQSIVRLTRPVEVLSGDFAAPMLKSGSWYDPTHNGEGFIVEILSDGRQVVYWFTYNLQREQAWMIAAGAMDASQGSFSLDMLKPIGGRFGPDFDPDDVEFPPSGTTRLALPCTSAHSSFVASDLDAFTDIDLDLVKLVGIGGSDCSDPALTNLFPLAEGAATVPDHEAGTQLSWLLDRFADSAPFTDKQLEDHFAPGFLAAVGMEATRTYLQNNRSAFPSPRLIDPVNMSAMRMTGVISGSNNADAWFVLDVSLSSGLITQLSFAPFGNGGMGSVVFFDDRPLNLEQAADRFASYYDQPGLLVARINGAGQCEVVTGRQESTPRSTASIFKIWILAGVANALDERALFHDDIVPLDGAKKVRGGQLFSEPNGLPLSIDRLSRLMIGISDNTATDMLLALAGRDRIDGLHEEYGHSRPRLMRPQLGISEQFHLFFSFPMSESLSYVQGSESFQREFLEERIVPLGSAETGGGGFFNESLFIDGAWQASPMDICGAFARHRNHTPGSDAALLVERTMQRGAAQPNLRERWDRVWYKGGSLESGANGLLVLTHAWMLEREGERPVVVVGMANHPAGNISGQEMQSILGRIHELAAELPP